MLMLHITTIASVHVGIHEVHQVMHLERPRVTLPKPALIRFEDPECRIVGYLKFIAVLLIHSAVHLCKYVCGLRGIFNLAGKLVPQLWSPSVRGILETRVEKHERWFAATRDLITPGTVS